MAQLGSAPGLGPGGRGFESPLPDVINEIDSAKYIAFSSLKSNGTPVSTAVWVVPFADGYGFTTGASSFKIKRIAKNPNITVCVCDRSGAVKPDATIYHGTSCVLDEISSEQVARAIRTKYFVLGRLLHLYDSVVGVLRPSKRASNTAIKFVLQD